MTDIFLPDVFPFSNAQVLLCLESSCSCSANYGYQADVVNPPPIGNWALTEQEFSRIGLGFDCEDMTYSEVEFRVVCPECAYQPGDEARARMVFREPSTPVVPYTWGRIKVISEQGP